MRLWLTKEEVAEYKQQHKYAQSYQRTSVFRIYFFMILHTAFTFNSLLQVQIILET